VVDYVVGDDCVMGGGDFVGVVVRVVIDDEYSGFDFVDFGWDLVEYCVDVVCFVVGGY